METHREEERDVLGSVDAGDQAGGNRKTG